MNSPDGTAPSQLRADSFWRGAFTLLQLPRAGYRSGLDALLVASAVPQDATGHCLDLGAGAGAIGLAAATRAPGLAVTLVEQVPEMADCARRALNLPQNAALSPRTRVVCADATAPRPAREACGLCDGAFDLILTNPPFYPPDHRASPDPLRRQALTVPGPNFLARWFTVASALSRHGGRLVTILPPAGLGLFLAAVEGRFGDVSLRPVHTRRDAAACRMLLAARRGSRGPLRILPGLDLSDGSDGLAALNEGSLHLVL